MYYNVNLLGKSQLEDREETWKITLIWILGK